MRASNPAGASVRVVEAPAKWEKLYLLPKEINRLIGGIDMLDVEENHGGEVKGSEAFLILQSSTVPTDRRSFWKNAFGRRGYHTW